jgi:acetyl esterase/lipase
VANEEAQYYCHLLEKEGIPTKLVVYPGLPHTWWYFYSQISTTKQWAKDIVDGVQWLLNFSAPKTAVSKL